jgi:hypothetical protein
MPRVLTSTESELGSTAVAGSVVFAPHELRPFIGDLVAQIIRALYPRLPSFVRMFVRVETLIEWALRVLQSKALPGSPSLASDPSV